MVVMVELTTEIDTRAMDRVIKIAPRVFKIHLGDALDRIGKGFLKRWKAGCLQGPPGVRGASGHGLFGTVKRVFFVTSTIEGMGTEIYTESKIARLHETGGIVTDPGGGRLAVPLSARTQMFTAKGKLRASYKRPRALRNVRPIRLKGKTFLARVTKRLRKILPLYVLKRFVRLKPRLGFYRTWDGLINYRIEILNDAIYKALREI